MQFYVDKRTKSYGGEPSDVSPRIPNSFTLKYDAWDDYSLKCRFNLHYFDQNGKDEYLGKLRIVCCESEKELCEKGEDTTINWLPNDFESLNDNFYSLGIDLEYYQRLKQLLPNDVDDILEKLKDCSATPRRYETATKSFPQLIFRLTRDKTAQDVLLETQAVLKGVEIENAHKFTYLFKPEYAQSHSEVSFDFDTLDRKVNKNLFFNNSICGIIGNNGAGKSQLLRSITEDICHNRQENFASHVPIFQKIIYLSSSFLDKGPIISSSSYNYVYSGIPHDKAIMAREFIKEKISNSHILIKNSYREKELIDILYTLLEFPVVDSFISHDAENDKKIIDIDSLKEKIDILSSGECMLIMHAFTILSNIFTGSLILIDEPENHLHPNAISRLINSIEKIAENNYSCAIIATHSPIIIQAMRAKNVITLERNEKSCEFSKLDFETLGCNLSTITDKIFHNDAIGTPYKDKIKRIKHAGIAKERLYASLCSEPEDLSLSLYLFIEAVYRSNDR